MKNSHQSTLDIADNVFFDTVTRKIIQLVQTDLSHSPADLSVKRRTAEILLNGLLLDLDANLSKPNRRSHSLNSKWHQRIMDITLQITENLQEVPEVMTLARQMDCSADHFSRLFKQVLGMSPQTFIIQARINRACYLLLESSLAIAQIAERTGYQDVYFFSRQFKAKTGLTPTAFRHQKGR